MKLIIYIAAAALSGCAGSPLHNAVSGNGFKCTMSNCAQTIRVDEMATRGSLSTDRDVDVVMRAMNDERARYQLELAKQANEAARVHAQFENSLSPPPSHTITLPKNYKQQIYDWAELGLKDPFTAKYKFGEHYVGYVAGQNQKPSVPAVFVFVMINSKNSHGGYMGYDVYRCAITHNASATCYTYTPAVWKFKS